MHKPDPKTILWPIKRWALRQAIKLIVGNQPPARITFAKDGTHITDGYLITDTIRLDGGAGSIVNCHIINPERY